MYKLVKVYERDQDVRFPKRTCKNKIMDKMGEYSFNFSCYSIDVNKCAPPEFAFMIGVSLALVNFKSVDEQMERLRAHVPNALMMAAMIIAAGMF